MMTEPVGPLVTAASRSHDRLFVTDRQQPVWRPARRFGKRPHRLRQIAARMMIGSPPVQARLQTARRLQACPTGSKRISA